MFPAHAALARAAYSTAAILFEKYYSVYNRKGSEW